MSQQLNWAYYIAPQAGVVAYAESAPGQGKTACIRALAGGSQRRFLACYLDQMLPEDIGGVPSPRSVQIGEGHFDCVVKLLDEQFVRARLEPSIVLMDELNQASHSMMAAAQEWLNNPPPTCWVFAAGNPLEQSSNGVEFTPPFVNRLCVVQWQRPVDARRAGWANGFQGYPAPTVPIVPSTYLDDFGQWWGNLLCEFETRHPDLFGEQAYPKDAGKSSQPWPSDRSWTKVGKLLAAADSVGADPTVKHALIAGCVGEAAATQFEKWLATQDLPDPEEILNHPHTLKLPQRFDISRAIIAGVIGRVRANPTPMRYELGYDVLEAAFNQQPELAMSAEGALFKLKPNGHTPKIRNGAAAEMRKLRLATV